MKAKELANDRRGLSSSIVSTIDATFDYEEVSLSRQTWRRFKRHRLAVASAFVFTLIVLMALFADQLAPYDPAYIDPYVQDDAPSSEHILGTDRIGRDNLSRLIYGSRVSLSVGIVAVAIYMMIGIVLGAMAGYFGGVVDSVISRLIDIVLSFPSLLLILVLVSLLGPSLLNIMLVLGLLGWPQIARVVRGEFIRLRSQEFIMSAKAIGAKRGRIIVRHILPNSMAPILVAASFGIATAILAEAALSFLGMGVPPPVSSWGQMLNSAQSLAILESKPWLWMPPGLMILIAVVCVNFIGDGLRDALDPHLRR
jgi:peptide/nickel transport system permease protein